MSAGVQIIELFFSPNKQQLTFDTVDLYRRTQNDKIGANIRTRAANLVDFHTFILTTLIAGGFDNAYLESKYKPDKESNLYGGIKQRQQQRQQRKYTNKKNIIKKKRYSRKIDTKIKKIKLILKSNKRKKSLRKYKKMNNKITKKY
jgi:hypothetical protein